MSEHGTAKSLAQAFRVCQALPKIIFWAKNEAEGHVSASETRSSLSKTVKMIEKLLLVLCLLSIEMNELLIHKLMERPSTTHEAEYEGLRHPWQIDGIFHCIVFECLMPIISPSLVELSVKNKPNGVTVTVLVGRKGAGASANDIRRAQVKMEDRQATQLFSSWAVKM